MFSPFAVRPVLPCVPEAILCSARDRVSASQHRPLAIKPQKHEKISYTQATVVHFNCRLNSLSPQVMSLRMKVTDFLFSHFRDIILDNKMDFTDIIKFFNGKPSLVSHLLIFGDFRGLAGFEPVASTFALQCSTSSAMKTHTWRAC